MSSTIEQQIQTLIDDIPDVQLTNSQDNTLSFSVKNESVTANGLTLCATKGILSITGEQRLKFLQGQTTCDTSSITPKHSSYGAFCNIKGRAIANFLAFDDGSSTHLIMHRSLIKPLIEHLTKFAVFFRVTLTENTDLTVLGNLSEQATGHESLRTINSENTVHIQITQNRTLQVTTQEDAKLRLTASPLLSESLWNIEDLKSGICWLSASTSEQFLPQLLGLEEIEGLSFSKGCYTGQEIIARMKYRGQMKRHLALAELSSTSSDDAVGDIAASDKINTSEKNNIGQLISLEKTNSKVLALLSLEDDYKTIEQCLINKNSLEIKLMEIKRQ